MRLKSLILAVSLILSTAVPVWADDVITLTLTRAPLFGYQYPLEQSYILVNAPDDPIACLILSPGGRGKMYVAVSNNRLHVNMANFLVRSRHLFAAEGYCVAVIDAATDFLDRYLGLLDYRMSPERIGDIKTVIQALRAEFGVPVWLVGTSRGTNDTAAVAANSGPPDGPDGLVLTSTLTRPGGSSDDYVLDETLVDLSQVQVPTLVVAHIKDGCIVTPPEDRKVVKERLVQSPRVQVLTFNGGCEPLSDPCAALSAHGFFGIEPKVVLAIGKWIEENQP